MFVLEHLKVSDAAELELIHISCFPDGWSRESFEKFLKDKWTYGSMAKSAGNKSIGFILGRIIDNEAEILTFAVLPDFQGKGCGRFLLKNFIQLLRSNQCHKVFLEVATDNKVAINLYNSMGFVITGLRQDYYKHGPQNYTSAYIMSYEN